MEEQQARGAVKDGEHFPQLEGCDAFEPTNNGGQLLGHGASVEARESQQKYKKTGLLSQRMAQKPGEFSDSVLLEDYGDIPTVASTEPLLEIFPG